MILSENDRKHLTHNKGLDVCVNLNIISDISMVCSGASDFDLWYVELHLYDSSTSNNLKKFGSVMFFRKMAFKWLNNNFTCL